MDCNGFLFQFSRRSMRNLLRKYKMIGYVLLAIVLFLVYYYPVQRGSAERSLAKYLEMQGIAESNIKHKRVYKDYTQNGYLIDLVLNDDDELVYQYKYYFLSKQHNRTYNILCIVRKNGTEVPIRFVKYPPLKASE